jgi:hypothetical protein
MPPSSWYMKIETAGSSEMLVPFYQTMRRHNQNYNIIHIEFSWFYIPNFCPLGVLYFNYDCYLYLRHSYFALILGELPSHKTEYLATKIKRVLQLNK